MKKKFLLFAFLYISIITLFAQGPTAFVNFLNRKELAHATVSFKAIDMYSKRVIVSYNENLSLVPASNLKIVTTATALEVLGSQFIFETPLFYDGFIQESTLHGNLYIKGSGDPTLGSEFAQDNAENFLKEWLVGINRSGIKKINGNIVVLDHLFGYEGVSPKWLWEDLGNYYAPGIYGISVFDNIYRVYLRSSAPGSMPTVLNTKPHIYNMEITNEIKVSGSSTNNASIFGVPFSNDIRLYGTIPAYQSSFILKGSIPDPGLFLAQYFHDYLQENGISVEGEATTYRTNPILPAEENLISTVRSIDLASIIQTVNFDSNNHYAEQLYKVLTVMNSIDIPEYWRENGLDSDALSMYDGSGISHNNVVSTKFLIDLLVYMYRKSDNSDVFYKSLPIAGKSGTVASFLKNTHLEGNARLKSGSLSNVHSYSGYIESKGRRYAVSLIINNFTGTRSELRRGIEQLFNGLF